jgi:transposase
MTTTPSPPAFDPSELLNRLTRIESALQTLIREKTVKEWYSTAEVATLLSKSDYTVREWCRLGRVRASKKAHARGAHPEWLISHEELQRLRNEGLLPNQAVRP